MNERAKNRLITLGLPTRRNELWTFFPTEKLPEALIENARGLNEKDFQGKGVPLGIEEESDIAALLPIVYSKQAIKHISAGESEKGFLKIRDEFAHFVFHVEKNASLTLEILDAQTIHPFRSERVDFFLEENASLQIFFHENSSLDLTHLMHLRIVAQENANAFCAILHSGKGIARTSLEIFLDEKNAHANICALGNLNENAQAHTRIQIHHRANKTKSEQSARHLIHGNAHASYDGQVNVLPNCSEVNSSQLINTLLLSETAKISVKPTLKIYHDNVECSHGCTTGPLDSEALFYLESRGFSQEAAKKILAIAFAKEIFSKNIPEALEETLKDALQKLFL